MGITREFTVEQRGIGAPDYGLYNQPEWTAKVGIDKDFIGGATNRTYDTSEYFEYQVPAGKTLFITAIAFTVFAFDPTNADLNQIAKVELTDHTRVVTKCHIGGNGGGFISLAKPAAFPGGHKMRLYGVGYAAHGVNIYFSACGYEV